MRPAWTEPLAFDPITPLLSSSDKAVQFHVANELLGDNKDYTELWKLPLAHSIVNKQQRDGSWLYPGGNKQIRSPENYNQLETFRNVGYLVEMFGFDKSSPVITAAADFLFSFQTAEGDIRGILGNQYTPYYTAAIAALLLKAGYEDDKRVDKIFNWLKSVRQNDGGWAIPLRTHGKKLDVTSMNAPALQPDKSQPYSHMVTGVVLRAYAAHPRYSKSPEANAAGKLLLSSFFKRDRYPDRAAPDYWLKCTYPFWFTDLISASDSLAKLGFTAKEPAISRALEWLAAKQDASGLWSLKPLRNQKKFNTGLWISFAICRVFKQFHRPR